MSNLANGSAAALVLSAVQLKALAGLEEGQGFTQAARLAGVHRSTLYRWVREDAAFAAAYNAWQQELAESARARMLAAAHLAVERVIRVMEHNQDLSFKVIKEMGILRPRPMGQINAERVRREMELEQREIARRLDEGAHPPAKRIASHVTTAGVTTGAVLPVAEPLVQPPSATEGTVITSDLVTDTSNDTSEPPSTGSGQAGAAS